MFDSLDISASALQAQRLRMDTISGNVANVNTTRNSRGEKIPYRRRIAYLASGQPSDPEKPGVRVNEVSLDTSPFQKRYEPWNKDAGPDGYVLYPNIDLAIEYVDMLEASRAYEANVTMMETSKAMINSTLRLMA